MTCIVAFRTDTQAYVLPLVGATIFACVISQPKYVPLWLVTGLPDLLNDLLPGGLIEKCARPDRLSCNVSRQKIYCWWMGKSQAEREVIIKLCSKVA